MHSGVSKTPLWSAEHLTRNMLSGKAERSNEFHAEERLSHDVNGRVKIGIISNKKSLKLELVYPNKLPKLIPLTTYKYNILSYP